MMEKLFPALEIQTTSKIPDIVFPSFVQMLTQIDYVTLIQGIL